MAGKVTFYFDAVDEQGLVATEDKRISFTFDAGIPGTDGKTVRHGAGAPSNSLGANGDFYISTGSNFIYGPKVAGVWPAGVSLVGPNAINSTTAVGTLSNHAADAPSILVVAPGGVTVGKIDLGNSGRALLESATEQDVRERAGLAGLRGWGVSAFSYYNGDAEEVDTVAFDANGMTFPRAINAPAFNGDGSGLTGVQPLDSDLTDIAALTTTSFGRGLLTLADAAAVRSNIGAASIASPALTGSPTITGTAGTGTQSPVLTITVAAHTALTASTEHTDVNFNLSATKQFAAGALATQRAVRIQAPTYSFVSTSTITQASTVAISGPPVAGTNATITTPLALLVESGNVSLAGANAVLSVGPSAGNGTLTLGNGGGLSTSASSLFLRNASYVGNNGIRFNNTDFGLRNDVGLSWFNTDPSGTIDTSLRRNAAGVIEVSNGTAGQRRDVLLRNLTASGTITLGVYTVATLPSASANSGAVAQVTDSNSTTNGATVAGGGANRVPVFSNGTNWIIK